MKGQPKNEKPEISQGKKFGKWGYSLAWLSFLATVGLAVYQVLKEHQPPRSEDYS